MYERHAFVCTNTRDGRKACGPEGSELHALLKAETRKFPELRDKLRVNKSGCLGLCKLGPAMVVYPESLWYANVTKEDVAEIAERTLKDGLPVERLRYEGGPQE